MTAAIILNVVFAAALIAGVVGLLAWGVATDKTMVAALSARARRHAHRPRHHVFMSYGRASETRA